MTPAALKKQVVRLQAIDAQTRQLYAEKDAIEERLIDEVRKSPEGQIALPGDRTLSLKDNFLDRDGRERNIAFKTAAIRRFEIVLL